MGMAWWNNLTERERAYWAKLAGTGRAKDAWEVFKREIANPKRDRLCAECAHAGGLIIRAIKSPTSRKGIEAIASVPFSMGSIHKFQMRGLQMNEFRSLNEIAALNRIRQCR
jgi:hypothetical protein